MQLKKEQFLKTVGLCTAGLIAGFVFPTITAVAMAGVAGYLYVNGPRDKANFFKAAGAVAAAVLAGPGILGITAVVAYPVLVYSLMESKNKRSWASKPFDKEIVESTKKLLRMGR